MGVTLCHAQQSRSIISHTPRKAPRGKNSPFLGNFGKFEARATSGIKQTKAGGSGRCS